MTVSKLLRLHTSEPQISFADLRGLSSGGQVSS